MILPEVGPVFSEHDSTKEGAEVNIDYGNEACQIGNKAIAQQDIRSCSGVTVAAKCREIHQPSYISSKPKS